MSNENQPFYFADSTAMKIALRALDPWDRYFRVSFEGLNHIPTTGGALLVGNHGPFAIDSPFVLKHVLEDRGRVIRMLADRSIFRVPIVKQVVMAFGGIEGEPQRALSVLREGWLCCVYPGGFREAFKGPEHKYVVRPFWDKALGFVRLALRAEVPIIPVACVGIDDIFAQVLTADEMKNMALMRKAQEYMQSDKYSIPITLGIGLLPLPVKLSYFIGEPIHLGHGPAAAEDRDIVVSLRDRVADVVELMLENGLKEREKLQAQSFDGLSRTGRVLLERTLRRAIGFIKKD